LIDDGDYDGGDGDVMIKRGRGGVMEGMTDDDDDDDYDGTTMA